MRLRPGLLSVTWEFPCHKFIIASAILIAFSASSAQRTAINNGILQSDLDAGNHRITNCAVCIAASDVANKSYVDSVVTGGGALFAAPLTNTAGVVSIAKATASVDGYLAAADFVSFAAKESPLTFNAPLTRSGNAISLNASGASVLLGRGAAGGAGAYQEISLGTGLTMTGTTLSAAAAGTSITSINGDTNAAQTIVTSETGSDFGVSTSAGATTLSLPIASATKTGKLSSTDWSTFNSKQSALGFTPINLAGDTMTTGGLTNRFDGFWGNGAGLTNIAEAGVTGLVSDLAGKAATSHTHAESDVTGLMADLASKIASNAGAGTNNTFITPTIANFVNANHNHQDNAGGGLLAEAAVSGLTADLLAKQPASDNLTNWSALATSTKQPASDNLTNWSAIATTTKVGTNGSGFPALTGDITTVQGATATTLKNTGTAGTYRSVTFDAQGRETAGTNPTTFSGYGLSDTSANFAAALTDETGTGLVTLNTSPTMFSVALSNLTSCKLDSIGTTPTDSVQLINTTAAAAGAQQYSPALRFTGQGWKTTATAVSQAVDFRIYNQPVQGSANPTANLLFDFSVDGGAFITRLTLSSIGAIISGNTITSGGSLIAAGGSAFSWTGRAQFRSPSDGVVTISNNAQTDFTRFQFGGTTAAFPAFSRIAAGLTLQGADGVSASTNNLIVPGALNATNAVTFGSTLNVAGATTLSSTLAVTGASTLSGAVTASSLVATNGISSTDSTAAVAIAATGYTNTLGKLCRVAFSGTAITYTLYDAAGSAWFTNAVAITGGEFVILQVSEAVTISGTSVTGMRKPL